MTAKKYKPESLLPTRLTQEDINRIQRIVSEFLESHQFVTNRELRQQVDIGYDQAIHFFSEMLKRGILEKLGTSSATRYVPRRQKDNVSAN